MTNPFSPKNRVALLEHLGSAHFDVLVIGGGITGAGIALDASLRGLRVALIEMQDFAGGTSGRSTKLIHGGLRYLKQLELKLVSEVGKEREIIHHIAPHLTKPEPMLLPLVKGGSLGKITSVIGMRIYEWLAGVKKEELHRTLSLEETLAAEPLLKKDDLTGGILFYEYRTDDARLTIEVLKTAVAKGATALNYLKAEGFIYQNEKVNGVKAADIFTGNTIAIQADRIVNAAGPWVEELDALDQKQNEFKLRVTKGVHLVVDGSTLPVKQALYFDTFDKRMLFVIPREGKTYLGTTDTFYEGDKLHPRTEKEDQDYILKCANAFFPEHQLVANDVEACWAGLRPLINKPGRSPSEISRKDEMFVFPSGLITIAGGKLTGYRKMAQRVVDRIAKDLSLSGKKLRACSTDKMILSGGELKGSSIGDLIKQKLPEALSLGLSEQEATSLISRYGSNCDVLFGYIKNAASKSLPSFLEAQLLYAIDHESCCTPSDFFIRRTGALYFNVDLVKKWKGSVISYMRELLGWDDALTRRFSDELEKSLSEMRVA